MPLPAAHAGAAVAGVGGQQRFEQAGAGRKHPGADHRLGGAQPGVFAAQRPGGLHSQAFYLGGFLPRERLAEPFFSSPGTGGAPVPAAGRASQIFSFTSAICPTVVVNSACRATSARTLPTSAAASCRPTVLRPPAERVHKNRGPWPGWPGCAHAQFRLPHLRQFSVTDPRRKSPTSLSCPYSPSRSASSSATVGSVMPAPSSCCDFTTRLSP